ncbi:hypothetical protein [Herbaspirillum sp. NPDC101396]|uniref:hypothetical protein n=1 Tax=Herbaspirillum sp. NPDC101396 TaxID=3364005 RepID=UPI00383B6BD2
MSIPYSPTSEITALLRRLLNPDDLGLAASARLRDIVRFALGQEMVEQSWPRDAHWIETNLLASVLHYPACWDTAAYPSLASAIKAIGAFKCSDAQHADAATNQEAKPVAGYKDVASISVDEVRIAFEHEARKQGHADFARAQTSQRYKSDELQDIWQITKRTVSNLAGHDLAAAPQEQTPADKDAIDADRWRTALRFVGAHKLGGWDANFHFLTLPVAAGTPLLRGSVAGHFTKAIDDARALQSPPQQVSK